MDLKTPRTQRFKAKVLAPLALVLTLLLLTLVVTVYWMERQDLEDGRTADLEAAHTLFYKELSNDAGVLSAALLAVTHDELLRDTFVVRDRQALLKRSEPLFEKLHADHRITHFYFSGADRRNFLRVHRTELHGDVIGRFTTLEAERSGATSSGLDLGYYQGLLTLRVVEPWFHNGELIGFLELGQEIDHIIVKMREVLGLDFMVLLKKELLVREYWELGMRRLGRDPEWDRFPNVVAVDHTLDRVPRGLVPTFAGSSQGPLPAISHDVDGRRYRGGLFALLDAGDKGLGWVAVVRDAAQPISDARRLVGWVTTACIALGAALFGFFYLFLGRIEQEASEANVRLTLQGLALESAANAIAMVDRKGHTTWVNPAFVRLTGGSETEALRRPLFSSSAGSLDQATEKDIWGTVLKGAAWQGELMRLPKDGRATYEDMTVTPLIDEDGEIHNFVCIIQDVTERKQAVERIRQARDAALEASRLKSEFLTNVSHELRTPLSGIMGIASILLRTDLTPQQREYTELLKTSGDALMAIIDDLLDSSQLEAGKLTLEERSFDLRKEIVKTLKMVAPQASAKGLAMACRVSPLVPQSLVGDPRRLQEIITNLVLNAVKFTHQGEIVVRAGLESEVPGEVLLRFTILDTGIGVPKDKTARIFDAFVQGDGSLTRKYGGAGLGLAIASQLVELMGGEIWVESEVGRGSTFHFTARFAVDPARAEAPQGEPTGLERLRVLVADGHAARGLVLGEMLGDWGIEPNLAAGPEAAQEAIRGAALRDPSLDVIICDQILVTGQDRPTIAAMADRVALLRNMVRPGGRVVLLTSMGGEKGLEELLSSPDTEQLCDPVDESALFLVMTKAANSAKEEQIGPQPAKRGSARPSTSSSMAKSPPANGC